MNKSDLITRIAYESGISKAAAGKALTSILVNIRSSLAQGKQVQIVGFGTFEVAHRPGRQGRNPRTGESVRIAAYKAPKFRPGKWLKEAIR